MNAAEVWLGDRCDDVDATEVCVADVSVDGATPVPMIALLPGDGDVVIPTDWNDPVVGDGDGHVVRIELCSPRIRLAAGRVQSILEGCHAWRLRDGGAAITSEARGADGESSHVVVASTVTRVGARERL